MRLSPSKVDAILLCPHKVNHAEYIESIYMQSGTDEHARLETLLNSDFIKGKGAIQKEYPFVNFLSTVEDFKTEEKIEIPLGNDTNDVIVGVIDFIEWNKTTCHIIDWKTGFQISDSDTQPLFYAFMSYLQGYWGESSECHVEIVYLNRKITKVFHYSNLTEVVEQLDPKLKLAIKYLKADTRIPNKYCKYCQLRYQCNVAPDTEHYPDDIIECYNLLKRVKEYHSLLDEHFKNMVAMEKDNNNLPENVYIKERKTTRVSKEKQAVQFLLDNGVPKELLPVKVDITFLRKHKDMFDLLRRNGFITESGSFEVKVKE